MSPPIEVTLHYGDCEGDCGGSCKPGTPTIMRPDAEEVLEELVAEGTIVFSARGADGTLVVYEAGPPDGQRRRYLVSRAMHPTRVEVKVEALVDLGDPFLEGATLDRQVHAHLDELGVPRAQPVDPERSTGDDTHRLLDLEERITWLGNAGSERAGRLLERVADLEAQLSTLGDRNAEIGELRDELARYRQRAARTEYAERERDELVVEVRKLRNENAHLRRTST